MTPAVAGKCPKLSNRIYKVENRGINSKIFYPKGRILDTSNPPKGIGREGKLIIFWIFLGPGTILDRSGAKNAAKVVFYFLIWRVMLRKTASELFWKKGRQTGYIFLGPRA